MRKLPVPQVHPKSSTSYTNTPTLNQFGRDLTDMAREGKFDPVIGRDREIERVMQILSRRTKNNPCLIGEPGVGKTAIAEGSGAKNSGREHIPRNFKRQTSGNPGLIFNGCRREIQR